MTAQTPQKMTMNMSLDKLTSFLDVFKKGISGFYGFFRDNKNNSKIMLLIALVTSALAIYFGVQLFNDISLLNGKTSLLNNLSNYDTRTLDTDPITQPIIKNSDTIKDLLQENTIAQ